MNPANEPILIRTLIGAILGLLVNFGVKLSGVQVESILALSDAVIPLAMAVIGALSARSKVDGPKTAAAKQATIDKLIGAEKAPSKRPNPFGSTAIVLLAALALPLGATGCAAGPLIANNPALANLVQKALAWLGVIDSVVSTVLKDPNVPPDFEAKYQALRYQFTQAALVVEELVQQGQESHQQTLTALDQLQSIAEQIVGLVRSVPSSRSAEMTVPEPRFAGSK